jgi:ubiquinone/menaquinone biosynthesis C-methylase UbiE
MSLYGRFFAAIYDKLMAAPEEATLGRYREELLGRVSGRVLEIGGGTGANLRFYPDAVDELVITEPEEPMARRLEAKVGPRPFSVRVVRAPAEQLPFGADEFDFAVSTLVLCTVTDPQRALAEIRRVLKPGGGLIFLEHVLSEEPRLARWQHRLEPLQVRVGHGCHPNRATLANIASAGFALGEVTHDRLAKAPPIVRPLVAGRAERPLV